MQTTLQQKDTSWEAQIRFVYGNLVAFPKQHPLYFGIPKHVPKPWATTAEEMLGDGTINSFSRRRSKGYVGMSHTSSEFAQLHALEQAFTDLVRSESDFLHIEHEPLRLGTAPHEAFLGITFYKRTPESRKKLEMAVGRLNYPQLITDGYLQFLQERR